ncbi:phosphoserine phosphatase SerB [Collinsella sp. AGMB00827]|uniref:phosphoserine phosphatase n=1 Tax=Collinsella ureilytica TaxID=2869515 RepID=A0ABS7MHZ2_9ACTN|nr:phosphoserine phosphatase SerB [Collinsella urealyticum]MBY4796968.1 phosphoserine phosphatase SerB [Collinsella urealyticum]
MLSDSSVQDDAACARLACVDGSERRALAAGATPSAERRLIVMDIDSTLINEEVIDLIADEAGQGERVADITARAMAGELDFAKALSERVGLLAGLSVSVFERVLDRVSFTPGALDLIAEAHRRGWVVGVVSGGFHEVADELVMRAGIDCCLANRLEVCAGCLTGKTTGPVVTRELKRETMLAWAREHGIPACRVIAIGDGANDIPMIQAAGIGIAFCAKPAVRAAAPYSIDERNLLRVLDLIAAV